MVFSCVLVPLEARGIRYLGVRSTVVGSELPGVSAGNGTWVSGKNSKNP